jgi:membrane protease YdiL (CAAX protease family)
MALFLFALALHLFLAMGGTIAGIDFKLLIIVDEIGAILVAPVLFALLLRLSFRDAFLLRSTHWIHYVVAGATAIPLQMFGGAMQELVLDTIPGGDDWRELLERTLEPLLKTETTGELALLLFGGVLLAAVCEELLFRGLMLQLLARGRGWAVPIFITGLLFALFHLDIVGLLPRTLLGVYFGILVWRSGSIFPAMLAHGANNLLAFAAIPLLEAAEGPAPEFAEAGLLALLSGAAFLAILTAYLRLTPAPTWTDRTPPTPPELAPPDRIEHRAA